MTEVIELKPGEYPNRMAKHALVISSATLPLVGCSVIDRGLGRWFFATPAEADIALMLRRATVWAAARKLLCVYLRRDGLIASARG